MDKFSKDLCKHSTDIFEEILLILKQKHSYDYAYSVATELTKIVLMVDTEH